MIKFAAMKDKGKPTLMGVPGEIREAIIIHAIAAEQADSPFANTPNDPKLPQQFDFSIDANGLRCHTMKSFSLLFVNKQIHNEAHRLVFRNSSVLLYVEVTHSARRVGFIPFVLGNIPNIVKANAREVAVKFGNVSVPLRPSLCPIREVPREVAARKYLLKVVSTVMNDFVQRKKLHIMAGINGAQAADLKILFKLLSVPDQTISLEEIYQLDGYVYFPLRLPFDNTSDETKQSEYQKLAKSVANEIGQNWFQNAAAPTLVEDVSAEADPNALIWATIGVSGPEKDWRGESVAWARRRVWRRDPLPTPPSPAMAEWLKERD